MTGSDVSDVIPGLPGDLGRALRRLLAESPCCWCAGGPARVTVGAVGGRGGRAVRRLQPARLAGPGLGPDRRPAHSGVHQRVGAGTEPAPPASVDGRPGPRCCPGA